MKRLATSLAAVTLIVASGAVVSARADDDREGITLLTPPAIEPHIEIASSLRSSQ